MLMHKMIGSAQIQECEQQQSAEVRRDEDEKNPSFFLLCFALLDSDDSLFLNLNWNLRLRCCFVAMWSGEVNKV